MARSLWTGAISFGLVNVPVALYSAVRDLDVHFRQLHGKDGAPIETRRFCSEEDKEVPFEAVAHGYEEDGSDLVVLTDDDLAAVLLVAVRDRLERDLLVLLRAEPPRLDRRAVLAVQLAEVDVEVAHLSLIHI